MRGEGWGDEVEKGKDDERVDWCGVHERTWCGEIAPPWPLSPPLSVSFVAQERSVPTLCLPTCGVASSASNAVPSRPMCNRGTLTGETDNLLEGRRVGRVGKARWEEMAECMERGGGHLFGCGRRIDGSDFESCIDGS